MAASRRGSSYWVNAEGVIAPSAWLFSPIVIWSEYVTILVPLIAANDQHSRWPTVGHGEQAVSTLRPAGLWV